MASNVTKFSDISSADEHNDKTDDDEILKLFDSEEEADASFSGFEQAEEKSTEKPKPKVKSTVSKVTASSGPGKGPGKNLKKKAPAKKRKTKDSGTSNVKKRKYFSQAEKAMAEMLQNFMERFENFPGTSKSPVTAAAPAPLPDVDNMYEGDDYDEYEDQDDSDEYDEEKVVSNVPKLGYDLFNKPDRHDKRVVISTDNTPLQLPKIFENETKFSAAISDDLANYVNSTCTNKADVSELLKGNLIPVNCKALVPPLINPEIWSFLYANIQQRDKSLQEVQKILGLSIAPMLRLADIFESTHIDVTESKRLLTQAISSL